MGNLTPSEIYAASRAELLAFGRSASKEQAQTMVPAAPAWSVRDVFAHVVGINTDFLDKKLDGVGSDAWTAVQVEQRADRSLAEICDEWESIAPRIDAFGAANPDMAVRLNGDLVVHIHDIGGAVDHKFDRRSRGVIATMDRYVSSFTDRITDAGLNDVAVIATDVETTARQMNTPVILSGTAFELMRAMTGRRSESQVREMNWVGDHEAHRLLISAYGTPTEDLLE